MPLTEEELKTIGSAIKKWRQSKGLSIFALLENFDFDSSNFSKIERGRRKVPITLLFYLRSLGFDVGAAFDAIPLNPQHSEIRNGEMLPVELLLAFHCHKVDINQLLDKIIESYKNATKVI